jgi:hypothetical protein
MRRHRLDLRLFAPSNRVAGPARPDVAPAVRPATSGERQLATDQQRKAALDVLAELVPAGVLSRARELVREMQREETVRSHLAKNAIGIVAVGLVAILVSTAGTMLLLGYAFRELGPVASWIRILIFGFGVALWLAGVLIPLFFYLSGLQREAMRGRESAKQH